MNRLTLLLAAASLFVGVGAASASCRIHNDTGHSFTVESGNVSNQSVGSHTTTSISAGKVIAKSSDGKSFGGFCKDGDEVEVTEKDGVIMMAPK